MIRRLWLSLMGAQDRISYRRLLAWVAATTLLVLGHLDPWAWVVVTGIFIGGEAAERVAMLTTRRP